MKRITLFFSAFLVSVFLLLSSTLYANKRSVETIESSFLWLNKSYAPMLDLQPYFNFKHQNLAAAAAACVAQSLPFFEGFDTGSTSLACWTIVDENKDSTSPTGSYIWRPYEYGFFEGTHSMYFSGNSKNDDWLISPTFKLDATKFYKLKYRYRTTTSYVNEFEVLASNSGVAITNFTKAIVPKRNYSNGDWVEETAFISNFAGDVNIAWHVTTQTYTTVYIDSVILEEVTCVEPLGLGVKGVKTDQATIFWNDPVGASWEYHVEAAGGVGPVGAGTASTTTEALITKDYLNKNLTQNTAYEYYVRTKCANGAFGEWSGPFKFHTACLAITVPFTDGFNTNSTTINCWKIVDNNKDATSPTGNNIFKQSSSTPQEGDRVMYFYGSGSNTHDDWLISPTLKMNGGVYAISYYYKTSTYYDNEFEVVLSKDGQAPTDFKMKLEAPKKRSTDTYTKKTLYVNNITGDVNIAWHVVAKGTAYLYIDMVTIEEVSCMAPNDDVKAVKIEKNSAEFSWTDPNNSSWEYFVQPMGSGAAPVGSGSIANSDSAIFSKTSGSAGTNLQPNTYYEFFVRASCGPGKTSPWVGPVVFKTPCDSVNLPFWEGFNTGSTSMDCWSIVDNNKDATTYDNIWKQYQYGGSEGDKSMYFSGSDKAHDDWLISPTIKFVATKFYRLKFDYKTSNYSKTDFEVRLSNKGLALGGFTTVLHTAKADMTGDYKQVTAIIGNVGGDVNIAWYVNNLQGSPSLYVDNVFVEEVVGCPEPTNLGAKDEKENAATINWVDNYGKDWEYVVQKLGGKAPTTAGTATKTKENIVTKDQAGTTLQPNTEYEFYVRTGCGLGEFSIWSGPFKFKTACGLFTAPFWEGFNSNSKSLGCWTIIDENKDSTSPTGSNIWHTYDYGQYEGNQMMYFYGYQSDKAKLPHNDWLISPKIKFDAGKMYRLKYHYKVSSSTSNDYEFEVLTSTAGLDTKSFTKVVIPKKKYPASSDWKEEYVFITATSGDVNIAWHLTSATVGTYLYLDNVFVEEVTGCPEPLKLEAKDLETDKATISWADEFAATSWQYYVQESGKPAPAVATAGTATAAKSNTVTKEQSGKKLSANTDYEFYVRTVCGNGQYSIWSGPFKFVTLCGVNTVPFWEGFNKDSKTSRCWVNLDKKGMISPLGGNWKTTTSVYEGDQAIYTSVFDSKKEPYNDYLVSPTVTMDGGMYVLKFHYKTNTSATNNNDFEVLISTQGVDATKFTTKVLPSANHRIGNYVEQVVFINNVKGDVNIAWHMLATNTSYSYLYLDNIHLKKVENCPEPYYVKVSNPTSSSLDVEWTQDGGITNWEVIVLNYGDDETATPIKTVPVSGTPKTTISGLDPNKMYTVYVRAKCVDGKSNSDWSTAVFGGTKVGANDDCSGAINIPVNKGIDCEINVKASFFGSTVSTTPEPQCLGNNIPPRKDIWFEFTATNIEHMLSVSDYSSASNVGFSTIYAAIYDQNCASISNVAVDCFNLTSDAPFGIMKNLVVGKKYYLRLTTLVVTPDFYFSLCINVPAFLKISPSGAKYTVEQLVKEVLVVADCDLVSNITYRTGTNYPGEPNGIGYFDGNKSRFGFEDGIILATNGVETSMGPSKRSPSQSNGTNKWLGDNDIRDLILSVGGDDGANFNASVIEFDFIPITDTIKFDFIFASNEYGGFQCTFSDAFGFFLTDLETDETVNLAVVPGTDTPVSVTTIRDFKYNNVCSSVNETYFDKYYGDIGELHRENETNYLGRTVPLTAMSAVKPGKKYHIKLAIADNKDSSFNSAVFLAGGSFDLGRINLGNDLLVENGTALCSGESRFIKSGVPTDGVVIKWYKDEVLIAGADKPDLEVLETGIYKITVKYLDLGCETTGSVKVEIFPAISAVVAQPKPLPICRTALTALELDLTEVEEAMLAKVDPVNYSMTYYKSKEDAVAKIGAIADPENYGVETKGVDVVLYIYVEDVRTGCSEIFEWILRATKGVIPEARENVKVCATYTLPALETDQHYYTQSAAKGIEYQAGDVLTEAKEHTIYVLQDNGGGCYEEISFKVTITAAVKADVFGDVELECALHPLAALSEHNKYFTQAGGQGIELAVGSLVPHAQTIYVYAASDDGLCVDESSFKVSYLDCPIQKGISPNGDGKNDRFDLSQHGVNSIVIYNRYGAEVFAFQGAYTDQWYGQDKGGKSLPDGTYYYVVIAHGKTKTGWVQINK
ncbi:choice-of-anchor J domain-containing protein [Flavobacterium sp. HSC-61S13]|uniref:choice-of-anchor J domain-containing protein n=1 Tax=Flavobacterium sp. HSC-61S13 TaxID=2910963 RepID=UPI0020A0EBAD|nr:choice-of-anchor J domain-containing protein [Flavobacterium sp. HSC-61S13]MCP1995111.1 gliding motility-associated-like protein [Flavobacterium sp. HSC-61S13]